MRTLSILPAVVAVLAAALPVRPQGVGQADYVVLAAFGAEDPFDAAAQVLVAARAAALVRFDPADLEPVRAALVAAAPRHVAVVVRPEQLDFVLQRRLLQLATEIDADPFVDFAFGYITGRTADEAVALARRGSERQPRAVAGSVATVAGGVDRSLLLRRPHALRGAALPGLQLQCAGEQAFPETGRDRAFLERRLPLLADCDVVTFVGHGMPHEVIGGPTAADLAGLDLQDAVVLNVACYTGVTHAWFEDDWRAGVVRRREVALADSFGLAVLGAGAVGYTAYLCPRPAGPELETDLAALVADGASLGEARRRDYDKTVLGFLGFGAERLALSPVADGMALRPDRDAVRDLMLEGATGGVLFGDPACVPFERRDDEAPVAIEVEAVDGALRVRARAAAMAVWLHCADPTARWGRTMAMRVHARVPLAGRLVEDVVVDELRVGNRTQPSRVLWAVEHDHGQRFLQCKVNWPRDERAIGALSLVLRVLTTGDAARARDRGGEVHRPPAPPPDVRSREATPRLLECAEARSVSREVLQDALEASAALIGVDGARADAAARLAACGSEGFRAVCALIEVGHTHYRTWQLLRETWRPGDERHLLALAARDDLPGFASWAALEGLGCADTPAVREFLRQLLPAETDPGRFMAAAAGLAHLGAREAVDDIAAAVLAFRPEWVGVAPHLITSLGELGGEAAVRQLEAIGRDPRCAQLAAVLAALDRLDRDAADRVRAARGGR